MKNRKYKKIGKLFEKDFINNYDSPIESDHLFFGNHEGVALSNFENDYDEEPEPANFENSYER